MIKLFVFLIFLLFNFIEAQDSIDVIKINGIHKKYDLNEIDKISFKESNLLLSGLNETIPINEILVIIFSSKNVTSEKSPFITDSQNVSINPNPFNPSTKICFTLVRSSKVSVSVFNSSGKLIQSIINGVKAAGNISLYWNSCDNNGKRLPSGIYYITIKIDAKTVTRRAILIR